MLPINDPHVQTVIRAPSVQSQWVLQRCSRACRCCVVTGSGAEASSSDEEECGGNNSNDDIRQDHGTHPYETEVEDLDCGEHDGRRECDYSMRDVRNAHETADTGWMCCWLTS